MIDFSNCTKTEISYSGSEKKLGIRYKDICYMLKFRKEVQGRLSYSHISEYLSSHIMELAGLDVHHTILGIYEGQEVVAARDFVSGTEYSLIEFSATGDSSFDTDRKEHTSYEYEEILYLLSKHAKFVDTQTLIQRFWDMFIVDALVANFDRHGYNWGFLKRDNDYRLAPVYDNGSSLFPRLQDSELDRILGDKSELDKRTFQFPTSQVKLNGRKSSYYEIIHSKSFEECEKAKKKILSVFDIEEVYDLIDKTPFISDIRKHFYKVIIRYRLEHIFN